MPDYDLPIAASVSAHDATSDERVAIPLGSPVPPYHERPVDDVRQFAAQASEPPPPAYASLTDTTRLMTFRGLSIHEPAHYSAIKRTAEAAYANQDATPETLREAYSADHAAHVANYKPHSIKRVLQSTVLDVEPTLRTIQRAESATFGTPNASMMAEAIRNHAPTRRFYETSQQFNLSRIGDGSRGRAYLDRRLDTLAGTNRYT